MPKSPTLPLRAHLYLRAQQLNRQGKVNAAAKALEMYLWNELTGSVLGPRTTTRKRTS